MHPSQRANFQFSPIDEDRGTSPRFPVPRTIGIPVPSQVLASRTLAAREDLHSLPRKSSLSVSSPSSLESDSSEISEEEIPTQSITESQLSTLRNTEKNVKREILRKTIADVTQGLIKDADAGSGAAPIQIQPPPIYIKGIFSRLK